MSEYDEFLLLWRTAWNYTFLWAEAYAQAYFRALGGER
jgi:hypothetical protein